MKAADVARARLRNSGLIGTAFVSPQEVVRHHGAMQAQDYGPAKWAIGRRASGSLDADVDRSLEEGSIVRTHVLRPTWHLVARDDIRWMLSLSAPRVQRRIAPRLRELGLDAKTLSRSERVIAKALEDGNRLTRNAIGEELRRARIDTTGQRMPHILMQCELEAVICSGGLEGKQHTYALFDDRVPRGRRFKGDSAVAELTRRYLSTHGPASVQDLGWWSDLTVADIRNALEGLDARAETVDGVELWSVGDAPGPQAPREAHFLHVYDEVVVGYSDTRFFGDPRAREARAAWFDRSVPNGIALISGLVAGYWRRTIRRAKVDIEVLLYDTATPAHTRALIAEANRLGRFIGREAQLAVKRMRTTNR